jgi:RimJ/RimL family protein N-acetyltransferase
MMPEENFIDFKCPHCGDPICFPLECVGQAQSCPSCVADVIVPKQGTEFGEKLPLPWQTPTLLIRRLQLEDWKPMLEMFTNDQLFVYLDELRIVNEVEVSQWLESDRMAHLTTPNRPFFFGIETQENKTLVGYVWLHFTDASRLQSYLNIVISPMHHRKGYATEALSSVLEFCFKKIGLHRVTASCDGRNIAGWRLLETIGMRREGEFVKDRVIDGEWTNTIFYAMLEEEHGKTE